MSKDSTRDYVLGIFVAETIKGWIGQAKWLAERGFDIPVVGENPRFPQGGPETWAHLW